MSDEAKFPNKQPIEFLAGLVVRNVRAHRDNPKKHPKSKSADTKCIIYYYYSSNYYYYSPPKQPPLNEQTTHLLWPRPIVRLLVAPVLEVQPLPVQFPQLPVQQNVRNANRRRSDGQPTAEHRVQRYEQQQPGALRAGDRRVDVQYVVAAGSEDLRGVCVRSVRMRGPFGNRQALEKS